MIAEMAANVSTGTLNEDPRNLKFLRNEFQGTFRFPTH